MSHKALDWVYGVKGVSLAERCLLGYLAYRANQLGQCWPSMTTIKEDTDLSNGSAYRALRSLAAKGLLSCAPRKTDSGRCTSSQITLHLHCSYPGKVDSHSGKVDSHCGGVILEPSGEPSGESSTASAADAIQTGSDSTPISEEFWFEALSETQLEIQVKVADVLAAKQQQLTPEQVIWRAKAKRKQLTAMDLANLWRDLHRAHQVKTFVPAITVKQAGQFALLKKSLTGNDLCSVMNAVLRDWLGFGKFLKEQGLVKQFPDLPHVGFFLQHGPAAVQFSQKPATANVLGDLQPYEPPTSAINCTDAT